MITVPTEPGSLSSSRSWSSNGVGAVRKEIAQGCTDRLRGHHEIDVAPKTLVEGQHHCAARIARHGWRNDPVAVKNDRAGHKRHHTL